MAVALASHRCGPGSNPRPGVILISGLSLLLVVVLAARVFLSPQKSAFLIPIRSRIRGPWVCQSYD